MSTGGLIGLAAYAGILIAIVVVDFRLGPTAEYLNAYEIVRRTFSPSWPMVSESFVWREAALGRGALAVAWVAFLVEALAVEGLLAGIARSIAAFVARRA